MNQLSVDFDEFVLFFSRHYYYDQPTSSSGGSSSSSSGSSSGSGGGAENERSVHAGVVGATLSLREQLEVRRAFQLLDCSGGGGAGGKKGYVTAEDIQQVLSSVLGRDFHHHHCHAMLAEVDNTGTGRLQWSDLLNAMSP
jgi:hypothetical protein